GRQQLRYLGDLISDRTGDCALRRVLARHPGPEVDDRLEGQLGAERDAAQVLVESRLEIRGFVCRHGLDSTAYRPKNPPAGRAWACQWSGMLRMCRSNQCSPICRSATSLMREHVRELLARRLHAVLP